MKSVFGAVVLGVMLVGSVMAAHAARKPKTGIFGTIDGMKLAATGKAVRKGLVRASYTVNPAGGASLVVSGTAFPKRRGVYQILVIGCASNTAELPWTAFCTATYSEARLKHRKLEQKIWSTSVDVDDSFNLVTPFQVTLESFDGSVVKGRFSGSFDSSQQSCPNGNCVDAPELGTVSGEGTFEVPVGF